MRQLPYGETVTVVRATAGTKDRYGNTSPGTPTETNYTLVAAWPTDANGAGAQENNQGVDQVHEGLTVIFPDGADVRVTDQVRARNLLWDVYGVPSPFRSPFTGTGGGVQVLLTRHEG